MNEIAKAKAHFYRKQKDKEKQDRYYERFPDRNLNCQRDTRSRYKTLVFDHYGRECACCGETEPEFLSIDHMDGGGKKHRKVIGQSSREFYKWLIDNNFPPNFQTLCMNCNHAKGRNGGDGLCPHERERRRFFKIGG